MKRQIICGALGVWFAAAGAVFAQSEQGVVVELYTSQGCSSCPPADALLGELAKMPNVFGLALHVDYWDYIGWKDTFGNPQFSERQRNYARSAGDNMVYTPQMIIDGQARMVGNAAPPVKAAISGALERPRTIDLKVERNGNKVTISGVTKQALEAGTTVQLVHYIESQDVAIERGENAGLTVGYRNVVTSWQTVGNWVGTAPLKLTTDAGTGPIVVLVQRKGPRQVLAAARLK